VRLVQNFNNNWNELIEGFYRLSREKGLCLVLIFSLIITAYPFAQGQPDYTPSELSFVVYSDGYVAVDYEVEVDPTKSRVQVLLFGTLYEDLLIEDQDGLPLDSTPVEGGLSIDTLGAITALISYTTTDLTSKAGQIWTFTINASISSSVVLPAGGTIISLSEIPLAMGNIDSSLILTMPEGNLEIIYILGASGTKEHALAIIKDAEETIRVINENEIITLEANSFLQQAYDAFDSELFAEAEILAEQAKTKALDSQSAALEASEDINDARTSIITAQEAGRTVGLEDAQNLLQQAEETYQQGEYEEASNIAKQAHTTAVNATVPETKGDLNLIFIGATGLVVVIATVYYYIRKNRMKTVASVSRYDIEALFEEKPHLRVDDKEVLRYITNNGGEAFAAEIRERFNVPRTSLWRMIRRLEREEAIEVHNIGGQSLVRISSKYLIE
jgi:uncharacterized membrane protein